MADSNWLVRGNGHEVARSVLHPTPNGRFDLADKNNGLPVQLADSANMDAFSRLRVAVPTLMWDSKAVFGKDNHSYQEVVTGAGSSSTWRSAEASVRLTCDVGVADRVVRQTKKYFPYIPGQSQVTFLTFNLIAQPTANNYKRVGRFDDNNGIFLEWNETDIRFVIRTDTSGSPVATEYATQANWNLDTMDGSGNKNNPSGVTLDLTKTHVVIIDYQWLGVGRVRVGFDIGGSILYVNEFPHANIGTIVYMGTPNLPVRYEVSNTGISPSTNYIDAICSGVVSEGAVQPLAHDYSAGVGVTGVSVGQTRVPVLALRQSLTYNGKVNRRISVLNSVNMLSLGDNVLYEVVQYPTPDIAITGGWVSVDADHTSLQYAVGANIVVNTAVGAHSFYHDYLTSATQGQKVSPGAANTALGLRTHHNEMLVNYDGTACEVLVIWATSLSVTGSTVYAEANCLEYA